MLTIRFDGSATERYLDALGKKLANPEPLLKGVGEDVMHSTKERFKSGTAPDGLAWAPNSDVKRRGARHRVSLALVPRWFFWWALPDVKTQGQQGASLTWS